MVKEKKTKILLFSTIFIILVILSFFSPKIVLADSPISQGWFCAKTTYCSDREGQPYQEGTCTLKHGHRVRLEVDPAFKPLPNHDETYLVECLSVVVDNKTEFLCTTGSSDLDKQAFNSDIFSRLSSNFQYSLSIDGNYGIFKIVDNQAARFTEPKVFKTGPSSNLIIKGDNEPVSILEWQSYTPQSFARKFYFYQKIQPQPTVEPGQGGQQQATSFDWINADKECVIIQWDPAGRVFDALTLEPIPNASVFLTKDAGRGNFVNASQFELGIINPQLTNLQGGFSFLVSDGDYKLTINNLSSLGYQKMASSTNEINAKYSQVYYYLVSGLKKTFIYPAQGEVIQQRGKLEYRDIPLVPIGGVGKTYPLKILSSFYNVNKSSGKVIFEGNVSHPFTQVLIYGMNNDQKEKVVYQGITDNFGKYEIVFSQEENGKIYDSFSVDFQKTNLTTLTKKNSFLAKLISWLPIKKLVFAQTEAVNKVSLKLDPIPTYLEGVAYDSTGKALANSQVKIYIKGVNMPYTVVNTDDQGYFKISSNSLPSFPYEIKYQNPAGKVVAVSTSKFIADNRHLISSKKIDLYSLRNDQGKLIEVKPKITQSQLATSSENWDKRSGGDNQEGFSSIKETKTPPLKDAKTNPSSLNSGIILILAIIFFLLIVVGVIIYFYFRQKKSSSTLV